MVLISGDVRFLHDLILGQETKQIEFHFLPWEEEKRRLHSDTSSGVERPQSKFTLKKGHLMFVLTKKKIICHLFKISNALVL